MLTVVLGCIELLQSQPQWQYKGNVLEGLPLLGFTLPYT